MTEQQRHIFIKAIRGTPLSEAEAAAWEDWLQASPENRSLFEDARWTWNRSEGLYEGAMSPEVDAAWQQMLQQMEVAPGRKVRTLRIWAAAAAVLLLATVSLWWVLRGPAAPAWTLVAEASAEPRDFILRDDSRLRLFPGTKLYQQEGFGDAHRNLQLQGHAFFEVTPNANLPFRVQAGAATAEVVGTAFYLRADSGAASTDLNVVEGKVRFYPTEDSAAAQLLQAHESGRIAAGAVVVDTALQIDIPPGRTRRFDYKDEALHSLIPDLMDKFRVPYRIAHSAIEACEFTGQFTDPTLEEVLDAISGILGDRFDYAVSGKEIVISGRGCPEAIPPAP